MSDLIIAEPLTAVQGLFERGGKGDWGVEAFFSSHFATVDEIAKIPSLNDRPLHAFTDGCLVRYRCMIQDQFEPEYYLNTYQLVNTVTGTKVFCCGKYRDVFNYPPNHELDEDPEVSITDERTTLYCVSIPDETEWAKAAFRRDVAEGAGAGFDQTGRGPKREYCDDDGDGDGDKMEGDIQNGEGLSKRFKLHNREHIKGENGLGSILPVLEEKERGISCLVKVYGDTEQYKVASMVEFVGVLSVDPSLACFDHELPAGLDQDLLNPFAAEGAAERKAHSPPPSLVPRLHCILSRPLQHSNPLVFPSSSFLKDPFAVGVARELALSVLTEVLLGDRLASEYALLHMLSSVYGRTEVLALGTFAVNISHCPPSSPQSPSLASSYFSVLQDLVPKSHLLSMTLGNMNTLKFNPRKDYETNRMQLGVLQLSAGTLLVVDETQLSPGHLNEQGVKNLAALCHLTRWQRIYYDFQYYSTEFSCDIPVMVFSEGRSIVKDSCEVPLDPVVLAPSGDRATKRLTNEQLHSIREYLGVCREIQYSLPTELQTIVGDDFVALRKADPAATADTLHYLLCLARLVSISHGCSEMTVDHWKHVRVLEQKRKDRRLNL